MPHATTFKATSGSFNASMKAMIGSFNASIPKIHIRIQKTGYAQTGTLLPLSYRTISLSSQAFTLPSLQDSLALHDTGQLGLHTTLQQLTQTFLPLCNGQRLFKIEMDSSFIFFFSVTPDLVAVFPSFRVHHNTGTNLGVLHQVPTTQHQIAQYALHLALKQLGSPL